MRGGWWPLMAGWQAGHLGFRCSFVGLLRLRQCWSWCSKRNPCPTFVGAGDGGALWRRFLLGGVMEEPRSTSMPCGLILRVKTQIRLAGSDDGDVIDTAPLLEALFLDQRHMPWL